MSAFLGPIHFWLYNKIQFQESLIDELIRYASSQGWSDSDLADKYGSKDRRKLDEVIDESNIHGWLQSRIHDAEGRYAALVLDVAGDQEDRLTALKQAAYDFGASQHLNAATAPEAFHRLDDLLLDGMPCDQVNRVRESDDSRITWDRTMDLHSEFWQGHGDRYYVRPKASMKSSRNLPKRKRGSFMYCTEVMVKQHANISRMLKVIKESCCAILEGAEIDQQEFAEILDFIRRYADGHHHRREELVLFPEMVDHLEEVASIIIKHGMLVEHDLIRAHVRALDEALKLYAQEPKTEYKLQVLTEAMAYANRLQQHVEKENNVVYPLADRGLSDDIKAKIDQTVKDMEQEEGPEFVKGYMELLDRLEKKYKIA